MFEALTFSPPYPPPALINYLVAPTTGNTFFLLGPLYEVILSDMKKIIAGETTPPVHVISAQDMTMVALQRPLKIYNNISPPYTACIAFELWKNGSDYIIQVIYHKFKSEGHKK